MLNRRFSSLILMCVSGIALQSIAQPRGTVCPQPVGANLIVGDVQSGTSYAAENINGEWFDAFAFGINMCNVGDANALYQSFPSNMHPAFAQNLYKLKGGRIEQVAMSWAFHGFAALAQNFCGCGCNGQGSTVVGTGCSNPHSASTVGNHGVLGPRWQINAFTGFFPSGSAANPPVNASTTARRLRAKSAELEPSNASIQYLTEIVFVAQQEATLGNNADNASYRPISVAGGPTDFTAAVSGPTVREEPAIRAWKASDPSVIETDIQIPGEGLFILAAKATPISGNVWNYEYALMNFNSDLSGRAFRVPLPPGAVVTNIGFHDVDYHGGDAVNNSTDPNFNISGDDWTVTITNNSIEWATETYAQNINANALRWGTMYNFRFNINRAPHNGDVTLTTYKVAGEVNGFMVVPAPAECPADIAPFNQPDGNVNVIDLLAIIGTWGPCTPGNCAADTNGDAAVNVVDLLAIINAWGQCAP
jgi:hypothetical protein